MNLKQKIMCFDINWERKSEKFHFAPKTKFHENISVTNNDEKTKYFNKAAKSEQQLD